MYEQGLLRDKTFSLYLGLDNDLSRIWLGGYDRQVVRGMAGRYNPEKSTFSMTDEQADAEIHWLPLTSDYYWMTAFSGAQIDDELWQSTADSMILDSGSSINHIPTKEYNILLNVIVRDHECKTVMNPLETYYCKCSGADDPTFPLLKLRSGSIRLNFRPQDYLVYEAIAPNEPKQCMVGF